MTSSRLNGAAPPDPAPDADRLGDAWDDLIAGHHSTDARADADLLSVVAQLHAEAPSIRPTVTFRNHLRETLMYTSNSALPAPTLRPIPGLGRPVEIGSISRPSVASIPVRLRSAGLRWASLAAAIALILTTVAGAYLAGTRLPGGNGAPTNIAAPLTGSPAATPDTEHTQIDPCPSFEPFIGCSETFGIGGGYFDSNLYAPSVTDGVDKVELQSWAIDPGETSSFPESTGELPGISMDIVRHGAYAATFSGPVVVVRSGFMNAPREYPDDGALVELSQGDSVSYALGTRLEIHNPLETRRLIFKSIVFTATASTVGPAGVQPLNDTAEITVYGQGTLPMALNEYLDGDAQVVLTYKNSMPGVPFPPVTDTGEVVLGPVGSESGLDGSEGYVVWVFGIG